jgi:DNA repair photolyase
MELTKSKPMITTWGSTEAGDPVFDKSWLEKLQDINLIITKNLSDDLIEKLVKYKDKMVLHLTVTGLGGSFIEPGVPKATFNARQLKILFDLGFPVNQAVLRIDPMISVEVAKHVLDAFESSGVKRCRFSFLNLTNYTDNELSDKHIQKMHEEAEELINYSKSKGFDYSFESCAGIWLKDLDVKLIGCMSKIEAERVLKKEVVFETGKRNRNFCLAPGNRVELLENKICKHNCIYCFHSI